ncbi:MAG: 2OG-Fe(II) oxygenase, partial [Aquabacterium sp.]|nr:2OG-Fe(II) oxygenase [Ferruginibacter sp.]
MDHLKEDILNCLKDLKGSGKFLSVHTSEFLFPGMEVDGVGEIAYPINEAQAKTLIQAAHKAPFGKGSKTILDNNVRSAWEIAADKLTFNSSRWAVFLNKLVSDIKPGLGLEDHSISAHLYKMLIYETGDFFLPHKDSEKEKGMFGTMIIGLPSKHTGGELVVSFGGVEEIVSFSQDSAEYKINCAAFYADCDHEVKPLTSGYRICLVYNLIQQKPGNKIGLISLETYIEKLAEIFKKQRDNIKPHIILLGHQYTLENFSADKLKLNDRPKAEVLVKAAQKAGCYVKMCLVTSYLSGAPEGGGGYYDDDDSDEDAEMGEVYEEALYIEHWLENDIPALSKVSFEEDHLIASFALNDDEPIIKESTGYMGNYGPDLMHWYHYGAVMVWSRETNAQLLPMQNPESKLGWIDYFNKNLQQISDSEISAVELIVSTGPDKAETNEKTTYNVVADWIINRKDESFFLRLDNPLRQFYFTKIDAAYWIKLIHFYPEKITEKIFGLITQDISLPVMEQLLSVLRALPFTGNADYLLVAQMERLPGYFSALSINTDTKKMLLSGTALLDLFWIEKKLPQDKAWTNSIAEILTQNQPRNYMNQVLVPQLLALTERTELAHKILFACRQYLQELVNNKPQPPADWSRQVPATTDNKNQWQLLKAFLESPDEQVFDYRQNQRERDVLQNAISHAAIDLKTETIKKGSPHTLRIVKTQAAYNREMK